jgi:putative membrane protein
MARLLGFLFLTVLAVTGISFAVLNSGDVPMNYYFGVINTPVSVLVVVSLIVGAAIGLLVSMGAILRLRHQARKLQKQINTLRKNTEALRVLTVRE